MHAAPTPKGTLSRERLLDAGIELMRTSGLAGAGINEIVRASGAPKGSVYHHFPGGKQQIATEALARYRVRVADFIAAAMARGRTPGGRVRALFAAFAERLAASEFRRSCAAAAVCLDLDDESLALRQPVAEALTAWTEVIAQGLGLPDARRARPLAGLVLSAIEGAYIRGRATGSVEPFTEAGHWLAVLADQQQPSPPEPPARRQARRTEVR